MHLYTHTQRSMHMYVCPHQKIKTLELKFLRKQTSTRKLISFSNKYMLICTKNICMYTHMNIFLYTHICTNIHNYTYIHVCVCIFMFFIFRKGFHLYYVPVCYSLCRLGWPRIQIYMPLSVKC